MRHGRELRGGSGSLTLNNFDVHRNSTRATSSVSCSLRPYASCSGSFEIASSHYLSTEEFNGLSARQLIDEVGEAESTAAVEQLVSEGLISLNFGNYHPNPHMKVFPARSPDEQIAAIRERGLGTVRVPRTGLPRTDRKPGSVPRETVHNRARARRRRVVPSSL
jgi:hypothetical protein